jgi:putative flippase GtrA
LNLHFQKNYDSYKQKLSYLIVGFFNLCFGYGSGLLLYHFLYPRIGIIAIGAIGNILSITFSFLTYKIFVFKTKGNWLIEYLRAYSVYGFIAIFGIFCLWFMVEIILLPFWLSQGFIIILGFLLTFFLHKNFTFKVIVSDNDNLTS